jgi:hypothetical protein
VTTKVKRVYDVYHRIFSLGKFILIVGTGDLRCGCHSRFLPQTAMLLQRLQSFLKNKPFVVGHRVSGHEKLSHDNDVLCGVSKYLYPSRELRCGCLMGISRNAFGPPVPPTQIFNTLYRCWPSLLDSQVTIVTIEY